MNKSKYLLFSLLSVTSMACYATGESFTNTSGFYLEGKTPATCPAVIAPGQSVTLPQAYCGYVICATNNFSSNGCLEPSPTGLTEGGYLGYLSISYNWTTKALSCALSGSTQNYKPAAAPYIPFNCTMDGNNFLEPTYQSITQAYSATDPNITGATAGTAVKLPKDITHYATAPYFKGVNISGLEYDGTFLDALFQHPDIPDIQSFAQQGMNLIRLPVRAEYIIADKKDDRTYPGPINSYYSNFEAGSYMVNKLYLEAVYDTVRKYLEAGMSVDLDMHNYMRFCDTGTEVGQYNEPTNAMDPNYKYCHIMTPPDLATIWTTFLNTKVSIEKVDLKGNVTTISGSLAQLAQQYAPDDSKPYSSGKPQLMFGVMNEPYSNNSGEPTTKDIFNAEIKATNAILKLDPKNTILLSGNGWDPLHAWTSSETNDYQLFSRTNLEANIPNFDQSHIVIEVHQYFDQGFSGTHPSCNQYSTYDDFKKDITAEGGPNGSFASWMMSKAHGMPVMLTEFGGADTKNCKTDIGYMIRYMNEYAYNSSTKRGFIGWAAWRANRNLQAFNTLQEANPYVYAGGVNGIKQGKANALMPILME